MKVREILSKIMNCFKKRVKDEKVCELPYKIERAKRTIADVEEEIVALGQNIIRHPGMLDFKIVPVKKHKRHRIQKKWLSRYGVKVIKMPHKKVYFYGDDIVGHPDAIKKYLEDCLN